MRPEGRSGASNRFSSRLLVADHAVDRAVRYFDPNPVLAETESDGGIRSHLVDKDWIHKNLVARILVSIAIE